MSGDGSGALAGPITVLIIEDGDEYLENLSRFVPGYRYLQAHSGGEALGILADEPVDVVYLDMRFDRTPRDQLLGDHAETAAELGGDEARAWRQLAHHQGLYVLAALRGAGHGDRPVVLAYDFSREPQRFAFLKRQHPTLEWVPDAVTPAEIRTLLDRLAG